MNKNTTKTSYGFFLINGIDQSIFIAGYTSQIY